MTAYQDELSTMVRMEEQDNEATREDWERALDMVYGKREPKIELLVVRDPDSYDVVTMFVDGEEFTGYAEEHIDPGAGYSLAEWNEHTESVSTDESYSQAFRDRVTSARDEYSDNEYIDR